MLTPVALPLSDPIDLDVIRRQPSFMAAVDLCITAAGKEPKQAYMELEIDKGQWSRIRAGQSHFPHDKLERLMDLMGNDIPLAWLAHRRGKGLHLLESEQQRLLREKDNRIAELEKQVEWTAGLVNDSRARTAG